MGFTQDQGSAAEARACRYLQDRGLELLQRNYRVARGPYARGGEIDLIMREADGTVVFVEVRARASASHGGAAASISMAKRRSLVMAAQTWLLRCRQLPPCRFDVVTLEAGELSWIRGAFDAGA